MNQNSTNLGDRLKQLRKTAGLSQTEFAHRIDVSYSQYGRYELKGTQPPADILNKLANVLNTTVDFLLNGNAIEKAQETLQDAELLKQFKEAGKLPENEKIQFLKSYVVIFGIIKHNRLIPLNKNNGDYENKNDKN
jgi:transcriptional regulator with XRE-family HTH domain